MPLSESTQNCSLFKTNIVPPANSAAALAASTDPRMGGSGYAISQYRPWFTIKARGITYGHSSGADTLGGCYFGPHPNDGVVSEAAVSSVGWVPDVGFVASAPYWGLTIISQDGQQWSPVYSNLALGANNMLSLGGRLYAIHATHGVSQLVVSHAEIFPDFYSPPDAFFQAAVGWTNSMAANSKTLFVIEGGATVSRIDLLPSFDPVDQSKPSDPTSVSVGSQITDRTAVLTWTAPDSQGTSAISEYVVQQSNDGGATWVLLPTTATSLALTRTVTDLANGTTYMFRVAAVNASGRGPFSTPSAPYVPRPTVPPRPLSVMATPVGPQESVFVGGSRGMYNVRFRIDWTQSGDGGSPVTGYIIKRFPYDLEVGRVTSASTTFTTDPASTVRVFSPGDSVQFEVIAINASGQSAPSSPSAPAILR